VGAAAHDVAAVAAQGKAGSAAVTGPLDGTLVADFSRVLSGPYATMILGDLGADIVKVERPGDGDETRGWGPPFVAGESAYYLSTNRNKRSIALDLSRDDHRDVARRLIARAHVMIENFRPGAADRFGIGYEDARALNPAIVYASITGYGLSGPYAGRPGYDFVAQAFGGVMSITGEPDGDPQKVGVAIADITSGMFAAIGILAAFRHAEATGEGQRVHVSLVESQIAWLANQASNYLVGSMQPSRMGNAHPNIVPYRVFHASDAPLVVAVPNDGLWRRLCDAIGRADLAGDERYATNRLRVANRAVLEPELESTFNGRTRAEWLSVLDEAGVPCGPINSIGEVFSDEHVRAIGMVQEVPHPSAGPLAQVRSPITLGATPAAIRRPPPLLGEHTEEILAELGYSGEEVQRLTANPGSR
jgi:crotonobetainyl-CoA:carnitine CoA-transferase CaiB-like acyl-CoA transferase